MPYATRDRQSHLSPSGMVPVGPAAPGASCVRRPRTLHDSSATATPGQRRIAERPGVDAITL